MDYGSVCRRCGCRDENTGRLLGARCPGLRSAEHGSWYFSVGLRPLPGSDGGYATAGWRPGRLRSRHWRRSRPRPPGQSRDYRRGVVQPVAGAAGALAGPRVRLIYEFHERPRRGNEFGVTACTGLPPATRGVRKVRFCDERAAWLA